MTPGKLAASIVSFNFLHGVLAAPGIVRAANSTWQRLSEIPELRQEHSTVVIDDETIAVIGGITPILEDELVTGLGTVNWLHLYDVSSDSWSKAASMPRNINHPNSASVDGKLYLLGGLIDANSPPLPWPNWVATRDSYMYDMAADEWTELEPMPPGLERGSAVMGVLNEMIYLAGGMTILNQDYQDALTSVVSFNTTSGSWQRLPEEAANIPEGRQHGVGAVLGNTMWIVGGRWFSKQNVRGEVYSLDLTKQKSGWHTGDSNMPTPRGGLCGAVVKDKIYTFGGEANPNAKNGIFDDIEVLDLKTQKWTSLSPMPVPRHGTSAVAIGDKIYIPGGGLQEDGIPFDNGDGVEQFIDTSAHLDVFSPLA